jgi:hypothetical protein
MSRQSVAQPRNLTLTEELEKLEQSITLTLQGMPPLTRRVYIGLTPYSQKSIRTSAARIAS